MAENLAGRSIDAKTEAALAFAIAIVQSKGHLSGESLQAVKVAGYKQDAIIEIVAHVAMNIFTNYFNHIAGTVIDFPFVGAGSYLTRMPTLD